MEEILGIADTLEINNANGTNNIVVSKKTIKIPFSTFAKIHNFRYPPISTDVNTDNVYQIESAAAEQEIMPQSEHNPKMEDILGIADL